MYKSAKETEFPAATPSDSRQCTVWEMADPEGREALVSAVYHHVESNAAPVIVKIRGLKDESRYQVRLELDSLPDEYRADIIRRLPLCFREGETITGAALRQVGLVIPDPLEEFGAWQIYLSLHD